MINREGLWLHGYVADEQRKFFQNGGFTPLDNPVIKQADGRDGAETPVASQTCATV
jgi:hypothetical protein